MQEGGNLKDVAREPAIREERIVSRTVRDGGSEVRAAGDSTNYKSS